MDLNHSRQATPESLVRVTFLGDTLDLFDPEKAVPQLESYHRLRKHMILAEREAVLAARRDGRYQEPAIVDVLKAIDAEETSLRASGGPSL